MNPTRESLLVYIQAVFTESDPHKILEVLDQYGMQPYELERLRVQYAIVQLSHGDERVLLNLIAAAKCDYRDVLMWSSQPLSETEGQEAQASIRKLLMQWMTNT